MVFRPCEQKHVLRNAARYVVRAVGERCLKGFVRVLTPKTRIACWRPHSMTARLVLAVFITTSISAPVCSNAASMGRTICGN